MADYNGSLKVMSGIVPEGDIPVVNAKDVWVGKTGDGVSQFKSLADVLEEGLGTGPGEDNSQQLEKLAQDVSEHGAAISDLGEALEAKADAKTVEQALAGKADAAEVDQALAGKADAETVNQALAGKADAAEVDQALAGKADAKTVEQALAAKADAEEVTAALEAKADAKTVEQALAAKADADEITRLEGLIGSAEGSGSDEAVVRKGTGENSLAHGPVGNNEASGKWAVALGYGNKAIADYAFAEGRGNSIYTTAEGTHVEGGWNTANGRYSHLEGQSNAVAANAVAAHVEGMNNHALHSRAHVEGYYNKSSRAEQHVCGKYNADNVRAVVIVGNGDADEADAEKGLKGRSNAYELDWDGNAMFAGKVTCSTPNPDYDATTNPEAPQFLRGYAVTAEYVAAIVAKLVGSAPGALDTLAELAEALGKDENFAATITAALSEKVDAVTLSQEIDAVNQALNAKVDVMTLIYEIGEVNKALDAKANFVTVAGMLAQKAAKTEITRLEGLINALPSGSNYDDTELRSKIGDLERDMSNKADVSDISTLSKEIANKASTSYVDAKISSITKLPTVTTSDNGSILRVVNGQWKAEYVPYAEEVLF